MVWFSARAGNIGGEVGKHYMIEWWLPQAAAAWGKALITPEQVFGSSLHNTALVYKNDILLFQLCDLHYTYYCKWIHQSRVPFLSQIIGVPLMHMQGFLTRNDAWCLQKQAKI